MNSKERVLAALHHEEPDRVPVDCGGRQTTFMVATYNNFKAHLGLSDLPTRLMNNKWQTVYVAEQILERYGIDCRHIRPPNLVDQALSPASKSSNEYTTEREYIFVDEWGVKRKVADGYASIIEHPLQTAILEDLERYPWPNHSEVYDYSKIRSEAQQLNAEGEYAIVGSSGSPGTIFEQAWYLRGLTEFFLDLVDNKDFAHALLSKVLEFRKQNAESCLREIGEFLDVFQLADDLAMQNGPFMSSELYREMVKPYQVELFKIVKELTPAKIYYHSCGAVVALLDDLIDVGVDILNPVQVSANGMETDQLKRRYGKTLSFWGAVDTSEVLPNGTVEDVYHEVKKRISELGPGGGYVLSPVHNMQPDIPPENIIAMFEAASRFGRYPLSTLEDQ